MNKSWLRRLFSDGYVPKNENPDVSESQLANDIIKFMDVLQDVVDIANLDVPHDLRNVSDWSQPYQSLVIRRLIWKEFGAGESCYQSIKEQCISRGYPQARLYAGFVQFNNFLKTLESSTEDEKG